MKLAHLLSSILLITISAASAAQTVFTVGGIAIGDTKESALKRFPAAECYVHFNSKTIDHEICNGVHDPVFSSVGAKTSFHIVGGKVSFFTVLLPDTKISEVAQLLGQKLGQHQFVVSPSSKDKSRPTPAMLWQPTGAAVLLDFEKTANGEYAVIVTAPRTIK
jgi:hypothetical protein